MGPANPGTRPSGSMTAAASRASQVCLSLSSEPTVPPTPVGSRMSIDYESLLELERQARKESHCGGQEQWCEAPQLEKQDRWIEEALAQSRRLLLEESFCHKHRINDKAFTRQRHF